MQIFNYLFQDISNIKGIGEDLTKKLSKLNIKRVIDLLLHMPSSVNKINICNNTKDIIFNELNAVPLKIINHLQNSNNYSRYKSGNKKPLQVLAQDSLSNLVTIKYFNYYGNKFLNTLLPINETKIIVGKFDNFNGIISINHPTEILPQQDINNLISLERIYPTTLGLTSKRIKYLIKTVFNGLKSDIPEWLDKNFLKQENLPSFKEALYNVHFSNNFILSNENKNIIRLAIDELLSYNLTLNKIRNNKDIKGYSIKNQSILVKQVEENLPFELTEDQKKTLTEIYEDMAKPKQMVRLIQGDVGSGKTIVALFAALKVVENNMQVALMVPIESLATQHYNTFINYCSKLNLNIEILKGGEKDKKRKEILQKLASGEINILIGTHAIFQNDVNFYKLGLVIIDEQHRFGVMQRLKLIQKGNNPEILLTTATPIPRTLSLAYYGDISCSYLKTKPKNRKEIITKTIPNSRVHEIIQAIERALNNNKKAFWICPLIEESSELDYTASVERYNSLIENTKYKDSIFLMHGKLKQKEKDEILYTFKNSSKGVLVSTTVIEVGIDIPDCNIIIIENANKFGLSQLHQLRGRVGRGSEEAVCILIFDDNLSITAKKRLQIIKQSNDGFYIAEQDYALRGGGDILGSKQSGFTYFKIANLDYHAKYLKSIKTYAKYLENTIINNDTKTESNILEQKNIINLLTSIFNYNIENIDSLTG